MTQPTYCEVQELGRRVGAPAACLPGYPSRGLQGGAKDAVRLSATTEHMIRGIVSCGRKFSVAAVLSLLTASVLHAQTPASDRAFVSGRFGAAIQRAEDGERGTSVGAGASAGFFINPRWALELEAWIPAYIEANGKEFRDLLFSGSALRFFNAGRIRTHLLAGFTVARVESKSAFGESSNLYSYVQVGGGVAFPLGGRLALVPEVRANLGLASNIVRPTLALVYTFR